MLWLTLSLSAGEMVAQRVYRQSELSINREGATMLYRLAQTKEPLSGQVKIIVSNTKYTTATLREGVLDSAYTEWLHGKPTLSGQYRMGLHIGKWQEYYPSGSLRRETHYETGALQGEATTYYASGSIERRQHYKGNKREGVEEVYAPEGRATAVYHWRGDERHGAFWETAEIGGEQRSRTEGAYDSGKLHGPWRCDLYNAEGKRTHTIERRYERGSLKSEQQHKP